MEKQGGLKQASTPRPGMPRATPCTSSRTAGTQGISQGMEWEQHPVSCSPSMKPEPSQSITHHALGGSCCWLRWMRLWISLFVSCQCSGSTWNAGKDAGNFLDVDNGVTCRWRKVAAAGGWEGRHRVSGDVENDVGKAGERHMSHEDSKESSEIPQGIVWQFHVWQGKVTAGSEDTSNPPGTCWNRVHMADLTPIRNLSGRLRCSGIKRLQALTIP